MKNRLLSMLALACAATVSLPAMADSWTAPVPQGSEVVSANRYYLYNTGAGQFLVNGNDWGTHASLGSEGVELLLTDSIGEDAQHSGWTMYSETLIGTTKHGYVFVASESGAYMDMGTQGHNFWKITKNADGTYRIKVIDEDDTYGVEANSGIYANGYFGWTNRAGEDGTKETHIRPLVDNTLEGYENACLDWAFISLADYAAYNLRKALYDQLVRAEEHPSVSTAAAGAVYNNAAATSEEIEAATAALKEAVDADIYGSASEDNPLDVTDMFIKNPTCESADNWEGAVADGSQKPTYFAYQGSTYTNSETGLSISRFLENWVASGQTLPDKSMYQALSGLPKGKYTLEADVIAVQQQDAALEITGTYLFADGGIMSRTSCNTGNGQPEHVSVEFVVIRDSVAIGFMTESTNANWVAVDNFKLTFYGVDDNAIKNTLAARIADAQKVQFLDGIVVYGQETAATLDAAIERAGTVHASGTDDEATAMIAELDSLIAAVNTEIEAYTRLYDLFDQVAPEKIAIYDEAGFPIVVENIENMLGTWESAYYDRTYNTADINAAYVQLEQMITDGIHETLNGPDGAGKDITSLLVNPNFDNDATGWTNSGTTGAPAVSNSCGEYFNKLFDMSQTITNLPNGRYTIKAQAFYRSTGHDDAFAAWKAGTEDVRLFLYGNNSEVACQSLFDSAQPSIVYDEGLDDDGNKKFNSDNVNDDGTYTPNSMVGAHAYFEQGLYENEVSCVVVDGTLTVGMRCYGNVISGNYWSLFDNFRVYYSGNTTADYEDAIAELAAKASSLMDNGLQVQKAIDDIDAAIEAGYAALEESADACIAAIDQLNAAIAYAETSVTLVDNVLVEADNISIKASLPEASSSYEGLQNLIEEITLKAEPQFDDKFETNEEVSEALKNLKSEFATHVLYDYLNTATEENPREATVLLSTPSFVNDANENSADGWTGGGTANYGIYEIFNKAYDFNQTVYGLAPGYYKITCQGFYRYLGHNSTPGATARHDSIANGKESEPLLASLYATDGASTWSTPLMSIFAGAATSPITGTGEENMATILESETDVWTPNTMEAAGTYLTEYGYYADNVIAFEVAEGVDSVVIGVKKDSLATNDWTALDNFQLFYVGKNAPTAVEEIGADKAATAAVIDTKYFTTNGVQVARPVKGIYIKKETLSDGKVNVTKVLVK